MGQIVGKKRRLLLIEDEKPILQGLMDVFVFHGYEVDGVQDGRSGLETALAGNYDLVLLDVMLPEIDGFTVCHEIKSKKPDQCVIMLTAKTEEQDIVMGLSLGADDYVGKPFSVRELALRVEAVLRRAEGGVKRDIDWIVVGDHLRVDIRNFVGTSLKNNKEIKFTKKEIELLLFLFQHPNSPATREVLLAKVWGYEQPQNIETRTVDIHIAKLRKKIEPDFKNPVHLVTVRGGGYRLDGCKQ